MNEANPETEDKRLRSDDGSSNEVTDPFQAALATAAEQVPSPTPARVKKRAAASKRKRPAATKDPSRQRGRAVPDPARLSKGADDRPLSEDRELTDEVRLDLFRSQFSQAALPDLPPIPGFHLCWLTTTNPRDTIAMRARLGYTPVKPEDVPGWDHATLKTGEYAGLIGVNELLAFKLPLNLYEQYMQEAHHYAPMREQEKLTANVDSIQEGARSKGADVVEFDGMRELRESGPAAPSFISEAERGG